MHVQQNPKGKILTNFSYRDQVLGCSLHLASYDLAIDLDGCQLAHRLSSPIHPGFSCLPLALKGGNLVGLLHGEPDVVEAIEEAVAAECVHLKLNLGSVVASDSLALEVNVELL